ncbi:hypothetical protein EB796_004864 [Bugula neritina]|uniref:Protein kinase domain-containing protein n=1 Tax=Bugula neritina TaxID=10212 RepID=A0A7J7KH68_BUGNE|nr:hypothetical protein EB796_004864 [Bugula neritina]
MWSLGVLLYSMASGSPPFLEDDHDKTFEAIKTSPYKPLNSSITKELRDIIYSLLNKNPDFCFIGTGLSFVLPTICVDLLKIPVLRTTALRFCSPDELVDTKQTPVWKKLPNMEPVDKLADEFGLSFNDDGELVEETGEKYQFQKFPGEANKNQQRYDQVGRLSLNIVQQVMEVELKKVYFHKDKRGTYIFVSEGYEKRSELLVLMQGSGVVRAGQWSRRLLLNDSIDKGTQLPYIRKGLANGWGIIVMNPNDNYPLEGCRDANEHARYVWKHFIEGQLNIKKIAIVAHSAGGGIVSHLLQAYTQDFHRRVLAIAFTEATYSKVPSSSQKYVESVTRNWVANGKLLGDTVSTAGILAVSAGTTVHEETSHNAIDDVFRYIWLKFAQGFPS